MSQHIHTRRTPGCYRCELNEDEMEYARRQEAEIQAAADLVEEWLDDDHMLRVPIGGWGEDLAHAIRRLIGEVR